jgi:hypothetical protein
MLWMANKKCFERDEGGPESQAISFGNDVGSTTSYDEAATEESVVHGEKLADKIGDSGWRCYRGRES